MITLGRIILYTVSTLGIWLQLTEAQNRKPTITSPQFLIYVYENAPVGTIITVVKANDFENDPIVFSLDDVSDEFFDIDNNGNLTLQKTLDREETGLYNIKVFAADQCQGCNLEQRKTEKHLVLIVNDVNDNVPTFISTPYVARIAENVTIGSPVIDVSAIDKDLGQNAQISYTFSPETKTDTFAITNHNGNIRVSGPLDFEKEQRYTLFVIAKDAGTPPLESETTVIIDVTDVSDNPPKFLRSIYLAEISENEILGSSILQVEAFDGDTGVDNKVYYEIISGDDEGLFAVDKSSGILTLNGTLDAEKTDFFRVTVRASEVVDPSSNSTAIVLITVLDANNNSPEFLQSSYKFNIREDVAVPGHIVTDQLLVTDKDIYPQNRRFAYSLSGKDSKDFTIDPSSGLLRINASLDYEQGKFNYTFKVFANETDTAEVLSGVATVTVELINVNDNEPVFEKNLYNFTIDEDAPIDFVVGAVKAIDADLGTLGEINYELYGSGSSSFKVDSNGTIRTTKGLDYETAQEFEFFVVANDGGRFYEANKNYVTKVTVALFDVNDNDPVFLNAPYSVNIMENQTDAVLVYQVSATDLDSGNNAKVSFDIISGNIGDAFAVNSSGAVTTIKKLDREQEPSYSLTVLVYDHGLPRRNTTTTLSVTVLDKNDNPPVINGGAYITTNISEGDGGGTVVFTFQASDLDIGRNRELTYAITSGHNGEFILNSNAGVLQISPTGLDRELHSSFNLTINVTDGGEPKLWDSTILHIDILDINDNSPEFIPNPSDSLLSYIKSIDEGPGSVGMVVIDVNATDKDYGTNAEIRYSMSGDENGYFKINSSTGVLTVQRAVDRESLDMTLDAKGRGVFSLDITATDQAVPSNTRKASTVRITVTVDDINDNTPQFIDPPQSTQISEAARPGSNVIQISASDKDLGFAGKVAYNITGGDPEGHFEITPSGYILVKTALDAEVNSVYSLTIEAKDEGDPRRANSTVISIAIDDVNDNDPVFNQSSYTSHVMENSNVSTSVVTVYATDRDRDENGHVSYTITAGNTEDAFKIDNLTGVLSVKGSIDRERIKEYKLTIQAEDGGLPSSRKAFAEVVISVLDENDNPPRFKESSYEADVAENSPAGTTVFPKVVIAATDADEGNNAEVSFSIEGQGSYLFQINSTTAVITTRISNSLDRETNDSYDLTLIATDGGNKSSTVPLVVTVTDVNDQLPRFSQQVYYANVSEDAARGTMVTRLTATDLDLLVLNKEITYTSTGADAKFYINRATGDVIVDSTLDREFKSHYVLHVTAANIGENAPEGSCQLNITITDVIDEKPYFESDVLSFHVLENATMGTRVTTVKALDKDIGDTVRYSLEGSDSPGYFRINRTTGVISTVGHLDRENMTEHVIFVQAMDSVNLTSEKVKIIIRIDDVNDNAPLFSKPLYVQDYREESPRDTSILTVQANDPDSGTNADIRFTIVGNATRYVKIDALSGFISQADNPLDREVSPFYNFTVRASDMGIPPMFTEVNVSLVLVDVNDNSPTFNRSEYRGYVRENQPIGTPVLVITGTDRDLGSNARLSYGLHGGNFRFSIDEDTGNITTAVVLDREQPGSQTYTLTVLAADDAIRSRQGTTQVIVTVLDDNDHSPVFSRATYTFFVSEDVNVGYPVGIVSATDEDEGRNAEIYFLVNADNESLPLKVNRSTGVLTTSGSLDRETNANYTFVITARDNGDYPLESNATVQVIINDVNDNPPRFERSTYNVSLRENAFPRTEVAAVSATDPDLGAHGQFRYSIEGGDPDDQFSINANSGVVTLREKLDHETQPFFNITISAEDLGSPALSGYARLLVTVIDVDDNAPVFHQEHYSADLLENATAGTFVSQINASDMDAADLHKTIHYRIEEGNEDKQFIIGELNGTVYLNWTGSGLDREKVARYSLVIAAISRVNNTEQKSTTTLTVTVLDVNDFIPMFVPESYAKTVDEDTRALGDAEDRKILTVSARDDDEGVNAHVSYAIVGGNEEGAFTLNKVTGELLKAHRLDREITDFYSLLVSATDLGKPALSSVTTINITVRDVNDQAPEIHTQDVFYIPENATVGTMIASINATDRDVGNNAQIKFTIISGNDDGKFLLNETTGELFTVDSLDYDTAPNSYKLTIKAQDLGSSSLSSEKTITIALTNVDDNTPIFNERQVKLSVGENRPAGAVVGSIAAYDADQAGPIFYYIQVGNIGNIFLLNETSGILITAREVDREDSPAFFLYIKSSNVKLDPVSLQARSKRAIQDAALNGTSTTQAPLPDDPSVQLVIVEIADENDNGPYFTKRLYTGGVSEDAKHGSDILQVAAKDADEGNNSRIAYELLNSKDVGEFTIDRETGWIRAKASYAGKFGREFIVDVIAKDRFGVEPYFNDTAEVKIYVLTDIERAVIISGRSPDFIRENQDQLKQILENITGFIINIDDINYYKDEDGKYDYARTAVLFHAVDPQTNKVVDKDVVIDKIDNNYDKHLKFFQEWKIKQVQPHVAAKRSAEFPIVLYVVIGLGILLFFVILIFCCVVCQLRKRQERKLRAATAASYGGSRSANSNSNGTVTSLRTTNMNIYEGSNPIWVDPYHNWGLRTDEEDTANEPSPFYGGTFHMATQDAHGELYEAQEFSTDTPDDDSFTEDKTRAGGSASRKSSTTPAPPEAYESSPRTGRHVYDSLGKYIVTSI
ncbi:cadherin-23-like isoform X2 [Montipora foliosa]|uniref:cadherin-23-like isoform X2 n=1 Tax=Montipora foliosa TaxID=591990 RepID=UPI0035F1EBDE